MREVPTAHQPHLLSSVDTLALWRLDEASSSAQFVDATGAYTTTVLNGTPASAGGLFRSNPGGVGARVFTGAQRATAPGDATAQGVLTGFTASVECWFNASSLAAEQALVTYGGSGAGGTAVSNILLELRITTAGQLRAFWQQGSNSSVTATATNMPAIAVGDLHHLAIVKDADPVNMGAVRVRFYVDGVLVDTVSNLVNATGGTSSPVWTVGAGTGGARPCTGTLDDVRVSKFAASDECVRDSCARGLRSFDFSVMYASGFWETHTRVLVKQNGVFVDLTNVLAAQNPQAAAVFAAGYDFVDEAATQEDVDAQGMTAKVKLRRNFDAVSIAPGVLYDPITSAGTLITINSEVKVETADVPCGTTFANVGRDWQLAFHGFVSAISWPDEHMEVEFVDRIGPLQDTWIRDNGSGGDRVYGSAVGLSVESQMQQIITDARPATGYIGGTPTLFTPVSPGWNIFETTLTATQSVAQALENFATPIGWRVRFRWDDHRKEFRLTFYEPDRTKTFAAPMPLLDVNTVLGVQRVELKRDDVRNVCEVYAQNSANKDAAGNIIQTLLATSTNATSVSLFGERYCRITLASDSPLQGPGTTLAQKLADSTVSDLAFPKADSVVDFAHRLGADIEDIARWKADGLRWSSDQDFAVIGVAHDLTPGKRRTSLTLRGGVVVGQHQRYFDQLVDLRGHKKGKGTSPPKTPANLVVTPTLAGLHLEWDWPTNNGNRRYHITEVHASTSTGFTPSSATLVKLVNGRRTDLTGLAAGTAQFLKLVHRDVMGNRSTVSAQVSTTPAFLSTSLIDATWRAAFAVTKTSNQNINSGSSAVKVTWDAVTFDTHSDFSLSNERFTAPINGVYDFAAHVTTDDAFGNPSNAQNLRLKLRVNNTTDVIPGPAVAINSTTSKVPLVVAGAISLAAGDFVEVFLEDSTSLNKATSMNLLSGRCSFSGGLRFAT